jgi:hypothetical protein
MITFLIAAGSFTVGYLIGCLLLKKYPRQIVCWWRNRKKCNEYAFTQGKNIRGVLWQNK